MAKIPGRWGNAAASKNLGRGEATRKVLAELSNVTESTAAKTWGKKQTTKRAYGKDYQSKPKAKKRRLELKQLKKVTGNAGNEEYRTGQALHEI